MPVPVIPIQSRSEQFSNYRDEKIQSATLGWWKWVDRGERNLSEIETAHGVNRLADKLRQLRWNKPGGRAKSEPPQLQFSYLEFEFKKLMWSWCAEEAPWPGGTRKAFAARRHRLQSDWGARWFFFCACKRLKRWHLFIDIYRLFLPFQTVQMRRFCLVVEMTRRKKRQSGEKPSKASCLIKHSGRKDYFSL